MLLLEIIIALAFVYLTGALFCSLALEWYAAQAGLRARLLRQTVQRMLGDDATLAVYAHPLVDTSSETADRPPSYLPSGSFARAVLDALRTPSDWTVPLDQKSFEAALCRVRHLPLRDALAALYGGSRGDIQEFERSIAAWFDSSMERASGWYKRRTRTLLFGLGLGTAVTFNLDTFQMISRLRTDSILRAELVAAAEQRVATGIDRVELQEMRDTLGQLPFGWTAFRHNWAERTQNASFWGTLGHTLLAVLSAVPGWLLTAVAISLGAPFWFDLLNRAVNLRGTGRKPTQETGEAKQKS